MLSAPVVQFLIWIFLPLNILFVGWQKLLTKIFHLEPSSKMSQEELLTLVNEVQEDGTIDEDEGGLLRNAIEFSDQEARDILIHRTDLAALPITATKEEIAEMFTLERMESWRYQSCILKMQLRQEAGTGISGQNCMRRKMRTEL